MKKQILSALVLMGGIALTTEAGSPREGWEILTPKSGSAPRINGAKVFGVRPNNPILFTIAVSGDRPLKFGTQKLPDGIKMDPVSGQITGKIAKKGNYPISFTVSNAAGKAEGTIQLKVGEEICLTPPMGFNSWYCYSEAVSDTKIRQTAQGMVDRGLVNHGWTFINIDDCWQSQNRGGKYNAILPNTRFPDMKALGDFIHNHGLKFGIYTSPWLSTYAGFIGSSDDNGKEKERWLPENKRLQPDQVYGRWPGLETQKVSHQGTHWRFDADAKQFADWGIDYLKIDWKPNDVPTTRRVAENLRSTGRDIILSLSNAAPFENAPELSKLAQLWRTTGDIHDNWDQVAAIGFANDRWQKFSTPGHFNDPDMLQIGDIGTANAFNTAYRPSKLTANQQYFQFSLWAIMASPLLISCDIANMDDFTYGLLTNDEIIAVNQDPLAIQGACVYDKDGIRVYSKRLEDNSTAVGIFSTRHEKTSFTFSHEMAKLPAKDYTVRDLWRQQDRSELTFQLPPHGCFMLKFTPKK